MTQGVINAYMGVMVNQIRPLGYTDEQIGRIGLASTLISCLVKITKIHKYNKVNRCLARYSPRATTANRPTNRAPKKPA